MGEEKEEVDDADLVKIAEETIEESPEISQ